MNSKSLKKISALMLFLIVLGLNSCARRQQGVYRKAQTQSLDKAEKLKIVPSFSDTEEVLPNGRTSFGNQRLGFWAPLHNDEVEFINSLSIDSSKLKPRQALYLSLIASGKVRTQLEITPYINKVESFVKEHKLKVEGFKSVKAKSKYIVEQTQKRFYPTLFADDQHYIFAQSSLLELFKTGHYNCVSSSLLIGIVLNYYGIESRGVILPTHVYLEVVDSPEIPVEGTSADGFDQKLTEASFEGNEDWFTDRGLEPVSYEEYMNSKRVSLKSLIAMNMGNQHTSAHLLSVSDRMRLIDYRAMLTPELEDTHSNYLAMVNWEMNTFAREKSHNEALNIYKNAIVNFERMNFPKTITKENSTIYYNFLINKILALTELERLEEAQKRFENLVPQINSKGLNKDMVKSNLTGAFHNLLVKLVDKSMFDEAIEFQNRWIDLYKESDDLASQIGWVYEHWLVSLVKAGKFSKAMKVYNQFLESESSDEIKTRMTEHLTVLEANWVLELGKAEKFEQSEKMMIGCIKRSSKNEICSKQLGWIYSSWGYKYLKAQEYKKAIAVYEGEGMKHLSKESLNRVKQNHAVSYQNWSVIPLNQGDSQTAKKRLETCLQKIPDAEPCQTLLNKINKQ